MTVLKRIRTFGGSRPSSGPALFDEDIPVPFPAQGPSSQGGTSPVVRVTGLDYAYARRDSGRAVAPASHILSSLDIDIYPGEFVSLIGQSGCGKTTLLRIIAGLVVPTSGQITIGGEPVRGNPPRGVAMVFQDHCLLPWRSVRANVEFGLELDGVDPQQRKRRAQEALEMVGLGAFGGYLIHELSGGMRQRVGIARALAMRPSLLLMDEPFSSVDAQTQQVLQELLLTLWERDRKTVLFVTHNVEEAVYLSDRVLVFGTRPVTKAEDIRIEIPRPRSHEMRTSELMSKHRAKLESLLRFPTQATTPS